MPVKTPTQETLILECLRYMRGQWISVYQIKDFTGLHGNFSDSARSRISDLKKKGYNIQSRPRKVPGWEYRLIEEAA